MRNVLIAIAATLAMAGSADAATYFGKRTVGTATATLSITTDGTIGALAADNVTAYTIGLTDTDGSFTLTQANSGVFVIGTAFTATATQLRFDFDAVSGLALFQAPFPGSSQTFYCLQASGCYSPTATPGEGVEVNTDYIYPFVARTGNQVIASTGDVAAVPEPASWAMMIGGFGLTGAALRRRRARTIVRYA